MSKKKKVLFTLIGIALISVLLYGLTYIPQALVKIDSDNVDKIQIFNGTTGEHINVTEKPDIEHIVDNLSSITFRKGKCAFGYMGYSFRLSIYENEKVVKEIIINSEDTVRYKGFFYKDSTQSIDYDYLKNLF